MERWKPFIIKPHFFSRYREREKLQLTGEDLIMHLLGSISDVQTNCVTKVSCRHYRPCGRLTARPNN